MGGKANERSVIEARRGKVLEYTGQGFSQTSMAKILGVSEHTIERDVKAVMDEIKEQRKAIRESFVEARIAGHRKRMDVLATELEKAKTAEGGAHRIERLLRLMREEEDVFTGWMQDFGDAPKVAEKLDMTQRVENPFEGIKKRYGRLDGSSPPDEPK